MVSSLDNSVSIASTTEDMIFTAVFSSLYPEARVSLTIVTLVNIMERILEDELEVEETLRNSVFIALIRLITIV